MAVQQPTYGTGARSRALANRLIASTSIAAHVLASTVELEETGQTVLCSTVEETMQVGRLSIIAGQECYFVASKFSGRFYVVVEGDGQWECSALDERVAAWAIGKVVHAAFNQQAA